MKLLLCILGGLICLGYFFTREQVRTNVQNGIENRSAVVGMTEVEVRRALGEPLMTKTAEKFLGDETTMTFVSGDDVTFRGGKVVKVELVKMSSEFAEARKSVVKRRESGASTEAGFSRGGGTALDRGPYTTRNGHIYYSRSVDANRRGTGSERDRRSSLHPSR